MKNPKTKKYHFLVVGTILFTGPGVDGSASYELNALLTSDAQLVTMAHLGRAQQALQLNFYQTMQSSDYNVLNVVITNIVSLGLMTDGEFKTPPEGLKLQEVDASEVFSS